MCHIRETVKTTKSHDRDKYHGDMVVCFVVVSLSTPQQIRIVEDDARKWVIEETSSCHVTKEAKLPFLVEYIFIKILMGTRN